MLGLALEGGGARGSYHIGVVKAYIENGYEFNGFVGTSIGAINGALLAQGEFEKLLEVWSNISMELLFDEDSAEILNIGKITLNADYLSNLNKSLAKVISSKGIDTTKLRALISNTLDEDKIRKSNKDYGLVTICINERKPYELFLEDIPYGKLINYIMASASFPGFKSEVIDENQFIDGGLYNNCPINMLIKKGYEDIIAVRTSAPGRFMYVPKNEGNIKIISSKEDLGNIMWFSSTKSLENIKIGYYDGLRSILNLKGQEYYVERSPYIDFGISLMSLDNNSIIKIGKTLGLPPMPAKRMLFEKILPTIGSYLKHKNEYDYEDFVIALLERYAIKKGIERYNVYSFKQLLALVEENFTFTEHEGLFKLPIFAKDYELAMEMLIYSLFKVFNEISAY